MERNFTNENFERFLRQNAEGLRMRPSDKVWKGISKHLNRRRRIIGFALSISLLTISALGYYWMEHNSNHTAKTVHTPTADHSITFSEKNTIAKVTPETETAFAGQSTKHNLHATKPSSQEEGVLVNTFDLSDRSSLSSALITKDPNEFVPTVVDSYDDFVSQIQTPSETKHLNNAYPLTIESVVNSYKPGSRHSKLGWQIYFTPTVSYRKLSENKTYQQSVPQVNAPYSYLYDINSVVTHKPDFGFEIGFAAKYPVSKSVKLRAGMQFNVNRYDIKAFSSPTQLATIRLNGNGNGREVNTVTNYNNFGGYKTNWLENFYFQVSAPVGVELKLRGDDKMQFGIASTIQPTYVLGDRAYLISTDYKNYAEVPWLIRRWNVNTNLETFVAYSTGHLNWQVGPQVRYQLLSSFIKKYPVKENLFDFGLKVGISLNNQ